MTLDTFLLACRIATVALSIGIGLAVMFGPYDWKL